MPKKKVSLRAKSKSALTENDFPAISLKLLERLEVVYLSQFPDLSTPDREIWFTAGQRSVIDMLRQEYEVQKERK